MLPAPVSLCSKQSTCSIGEVVQHLCDVHSIQEFHQDPAWTNAPRFDPCLEMGIVCVEGVYIFRRKNTCIGRREIDSLTYNKEIWRAVAMSTGIPPLSLTLKTLCNPGTLFLYS